MSHTDRFPHEARVTANHWIDGQMAGWDAKQVRMIFPLSAIEQRLLSWNTWIFIVGILALFWHRIKSGTAQI